MENSDDNWTRALKSHPFIIFKCCNKIDKGIYWVCFGRILCVEEKNMGISISFQYWGKDYFFSSSELNNLTEVYEKEWYNQSGRRDYIVCFIFFSLFTLFFSISKGLSRKLYPDGQESVSCELRILNFVGLFSFYPLFWYLHSVFSFQHFFSTWSDSESNLKRSTWIFSEAFIFLFVKREMRFRLRSEEEEIGKWLFSNSHKSSFASYTSVSGGERVEKGR
jgi:hypothetical protein